MGGQICLLEGAMFEAKGMTHRRLILSFFTFSVRRMTREYCIGHLIYGSLELIVKENDGSIKSYVVAARNKTTIKINNH